MEKIVEEGERIVTYPKVSIIILNWNGLEDTIECLESLKGIIYPNYEVIVVDNGSKGNDVEVLKERFGDYIHIIQNDKNYGFAEGCNIGMRYALTRGTEYLLLLNNDTVVDPAFLNELVEGAGSNEDVGIVNPKIYHYEEPETIQFAGGKISYLKGRIYHIGRDEVDTGQYDQAVETEFLTGCAMMVHSDVLERVGLFDSSYFAYFEDADLSVRARNAGYRIVYVPKSKIWHKGTTSTGGYMNATSHYYYVRNAIIFVFKHGKIWERLIFITYFLLVYSFLVLGYSIIHRRFELFKSFIRGLLFHISHKDY